VIGEDGVGKVYNGRGARQRQGGRKRENAVGRVSLPFSGKVSHWEGQVRHPVPLLGLASGAGVAVRVVRRIPAVSMRSKNTRCRWYRRSAPEVTERQMTESL